ncbi:MAG: hypothetical protein ACRENP_12545 [Longimicrobiales bacterium]
MIRWRLHNGRHYDGILSSLGTRTVKLLLKVLTLAATVSIVGCRADGANPSERTCISVESRRIDVAFLGHADTLPDARRASELLAAALGRYGINVHYVEAGDSTQRYNLFDVAIVRRDVDLAGFAPGARDGRGLVFYADSLDVRGEGDRGRVFRFANGRTLREWGDSTFQQQLRDAILAVAGGRVRLSSGNDTVAPAIGSSERSARTVPRMAAPSLSSARLNSHGSMAYRTGKMNSGPSIMTITCLAARGSVASCPNQCRGRAESYRANLDEAVLSEHFRREPLPCEAALLAGRVFLQYRPPGGTRVPAIA